MLDGLTCEPFYKCLPVQGGPGHELRTDILNELIVCFDLMMNEHRDLMVALLEVHLPPRDLYHEEDGVFKRFVYSFQELLRRQGVASQCVWVRQGHETDPYYRYECAVLLSVYLDVDLDLLLTQANALWAEELGGPWSSALVRYCELEDPPCAVRALVVRSDSQDYCESCSRSFRALSRIAHVEPGDRGANDEILFGCSLPW